MNFFWVWVNFNPFSKIAVFLTQADSSQAAIDKIEKFIPVWEDHPISWDGLKPQILDIIAFPAVVADDNTIFIGME